MGNEEIVNVERMETGAPAPAEISSPVGKFFIGAIAGCAAIAIPRFSSYLASVEAGDFSFLPTNYLIALIVFSLFLGGLVVIMEYKIPKPPKETFFAALAIPGLIAGSFNTIVETGDANRMFQESQKLTKEVQSMNNIDIEQIESIEMIPITANEPPPSGPGANLSFELISPAYAGNGDAPLKKEGTSSSLAVQRGERNYTVSIGSYENKEDAIEKAKSIKSPKHPVALIKTNKGYELLSSGLLFTETEATIKALELKRELDIQPKILKVK